MNLGGMFPKRIWEKLWWWIEQMNEIIINQQIFKEIEITIVFLLVYMILWHVWSDKEL